MSMGYAEKKENNEPLLLLVKNLIAEVRLGLVTLVGCPCYILKTE